MQRQEKKIEFLEKSGYANLHNAEEQVMICYSEIEGVNILYDTEIKLWFIVRIFD